MYVKDFFVNICIMCTLAFIYGQMMQNTQFKHPTKKMHPVMLGLIGGTFGCILMLFGMKFPYDLVIDYRNIALTLTAMLGGKWAILLAGIIMSLFRICWYGANTTSLISVAFILISTIGIIGILFLTLKPSKQWVLIYSFSTLCTICTIGIVLLDAIKTLLFSTVSFIIMSIIGGCIAYALYHFLAEFNNLYSKLKKEVENDYLTGLKNKKQFSDSLESIFQSFKKENSFVGIIMFDIDHFKHINDTYGHLSGDAILSQLGKLALTLFEDDTHCKGIFRVGGEEFSILMQGQILEKVLQQAETLRQKVANHKFLLHEGTPVQITISLGVSYYPDLTESPYNLVGDADKALYESKGTGRNKVTWKEIA